MHQWLKAYGDTEGPLGLPMQDRQAKALEQLLAGLPEELRTPSRAAVAKATTEVMEGERSDVSWISTECEDRQKDVVLAGGLDDSHFAMNPIVTLGHSYGQPPVGTSRWRKKVRSGEMKGIKAKTVYPVRPEGYPAGEAWRPDEAFALVQAGLMAGKSIGFLPLDASAPTEEELKMFPHYASAHRVVRKWLLLEYACTWLPVNQEAITEQVSKSLSALGLEVPVPPLPPAPAAPPPVIAFTSLKEIEKALKTRIAGIDFHALVSQGMQEALDQYRGRV